LDSLQTSTLSCNGGPSTGRAIGGLGPPGRNGTSDRNSPSGSRNGTSANADDFFLFLLYVSQDFENAMIFQIIYENIVAQADACAAINVASAHLRFGNFVAGAIQTASGD